jgi:hypothetical protein
MVLTGVGLAYAVRGRPPPKVLDAMHQAQRARRGVWAKGVPGTILIALHSRGEDTEGQFHTAANRVLNTATGEATLLKHRDTYRVCEEVCDGDSCMVYVPFELRTKDQPPCLVGQ